MLNLQQYDSLGAALRDALERWPDEICLIEADRERENCRLTYRQFRDAASPLAKWLQARGFNAGDCVAIIMTNQSKWLISAYAILHGGGVLVPLDYKLSAPEQIELLAHSKANVLVTEHHLWRAIRQSDQFQGLQSLTVLVTEAPAQADLAGAHRWEESKADGTPDFIPRGRQDVACIVYSSGTGGQPKGCMLTHENYLEQCISLTQLFPFWPGVRYLSILPTNHAIDFMVGFIGPFVCGATVIHLRTLRPEFVRGAFSRYRITYVSLVPLVLKNLEKGLRLKFDEIPPGRRRMLDRLVAVNRFLTRRRPKLWLSRLLLQQVHEAFGGELRAIFVGGAFMDPATIQFFYDLGIQVANGYGLTEAGTAITLNDFNPFRADTVGRPLPGMEIKIVDSDAEGVGQVAVRSKTVMAGYLDDPELTSETVVDGWLMTGDLGRIDSTGHLQLLGRVKNMIVTEGGKNVYPEDIENAFEGLNVKELCVFAANFIWRERSMGGEELIIVLRAESGHEIDAGLVQELDRRNQRLPDSKRISGYVVWDEDFPRTASMKIKRPVLAEAIRLRRDRARSVVKL
ncbi:MAG: AMP-binding protein [Acidobacteria bacterium]|nr:AMP-binding protein [Acidobacteriota bacterium]